MNMRHNKDKKQPSKAAMTNLAKFTGKLCLRGFFKFCKFLDIFP